MTSVSIICQVILHNPLPARSFEFHATWRRYWLFSVSEDWNANLINQHNTEYFNVHYAHFVEFRKRVSEVLEYSDKTVQHLGNITYLPRYNFLSKGKKRYRKEIGSKLKLGFEIWLHSEGVATLLTLYTFQIFFELSRLKDILLNNMGFNLYFKKLRFYLLISYAVVLSGVNHSFKSKDSILSWKRHSRVKKNKKRVCEEEIKW